MRREGKRLATGREGTPTTLSASSTEGSKDWQAGWLTWSTDGERKHRFRHDRREDAPARRPAVRASTVPRPVLPQDGEAEPCGLLHD
jgi:hypothetical protein